MMVNTDTWKNRRSTDISGGHPPPGLRAGGPFGHIRLSKPLLKSGRLVPGSSVQMYSLCSTYFIYGDGIQTVCVFSYAQ